ncbi:MAG TPA: hypothetical protein VF614_13490 [Chthoniobacteraceae bacterium]
MNKKKDCKHSVQFEEQVEPGKQEVLGSLYLKRPLADNVASIDVTVKIAA